MRRMLARRWKKNKEEIFLHIKCELYISYLKTYKESHIYTGMGVD